MPAFTVVTVPAGDPIRSTDGKLQVPDRPIIPFIEGDGTGPDIWAASQHVFDSAVAKAYGGKRRIRWFEVYAGEKAFNKFKACAVEVLHVPPEKVTLEASFAEDLDADSLDLVELVMALEEQFDITVDESELEDVSTVGEAFELVQSKL